MLQSMGSQRFMHDLATEQHPHIIAVKVTITFRKVSRMQ